jgi:hypothetical protein
VEPGAAFPLRASHLGPLILCHIEFADESKSAQPDLVAATTLNAGSENRSRSQR